MKKLVRVDAEALAKAGASPVLALLPRAIGGAVVLSAAEPAADERAKTDDAEIAVVRVEGPLAQRAVSDLCGYVDGYDAVSARFELALEASGDGVVLVIDSPGGDVAGLEEAVGRMRAAKDRSGKRVVCYVDEQAASAAYWIASSLADEIVVPKAGEVGSIGCIGAFVDMSAAAEANGQRWTVVREPAGKAESMPMAPLSELAEERLGASVKAAANRFYKAVSQARGMPTAAIRGFNGAMFTGREAVAAGLADRVGTLESALASVLKPKPKKTGRNGAAGETNMNQFAALAAALGVDADTSEADLVALACSNIEGLNLKLAAQTEKAGQLDAVRAELDALRASTEAAARVAEVERILQAGADARKVTPARREALREKGMRLGPEWLASVVEELPSLIEEKVTPKPAATEPASELSARELAMCAELGLDPKTYAANKPAKKVA